MQVQKPGIYSIPFSGPQVTAAFSGREFPAARREDFLRELGITPSNLQLVRQVHGAEIVIADSENKLDPAPEADGLIAGGSGTAIGILTADCIPAFFWDGFQGFGGLAHAGWRGLQAGILPKMVRLFRSEFETKPSTLQVTFGPAIHKCCYEVGEEFQHHFPAYYQAPAGQKAHLDLIAIAKDQLIEVGVPAQQIMDSGICTSCQNERFFSARRDKSPERILSVLQIR